MGSGYVPEPVRFRNQFQFRYVLVISSRNRMESVSDPELVEVWNKFQDPDPGPVWYWDFLLEPVWAQN